MRVRRRCEMRRLGSARVSSLPVIGKPLRIFSVAELGPVAELGGTLDRYMRRSSLDQVPEISGSRFGVFWVVYGFDDEAVEGVRDGACAPAGMDDAAATPIALTSAPMISLRMSASRPRTKLA